LTFTVVAEIADRALSANLPFCPAFKETGKAGGLVSLGPDISAMARQAAGQIDKIIKGASPSDIPVEQPTHTIFISI
jgi:putative ABC transport system substrate-binding protein